MASSGKPRGPPSASASKPRDAGQLLWQTLHDELERDEAGYKARIAFLDQAVKAGGYPLARLSQEDVEAVNARAPWNSCKFVNATLALMTTPSHDMAAKRVAVRHTSHTLGGTALPPAPALKQLQRVGHLSSAFAAALKRVKDAPAVATLISVTLSDVEIMNNPAREGKTRGPTFAHMLSLVASPGGVWTYQGYGPRGYTLLQHLQGRGGEGGGAPLTHKAGKTFVDGVERLLTLAVASKGAFTADANAQYAKLFGYDLLAGGNMKIGCQFDPYLAVESYSFDAVTITDNLALLPSYEGPKVACNDAAIADGSVKTAFSPDGGVPRKYTPALAAPAPAQALAACAVCGRTRSEGLARCARCKAVNYCCGEHQSEDWKAGHKDRCGGGGRW